MPRNAIPGWTPTTPPRTPGPIAPTGRLRSESLSAACVVEHQDRLKTIVIVVRFKQAQLLLAVDGVERVVDVQTDPHIDLEQKEKTAVASYRAAVETGDHALTGNRLQARQFRRMLNHGGCAPADRRFLARHRNLTTIQQIGRYTPSPMNFSG